MLILCINKNIVAHQYPHYGVDRYPGVFEKATMTYVFTHLL